MQLTITVNGQTGRVDTGGQGTDGNNNVNTAGNVTVHQVDATRNLVKHRSKDGRTTGVFNSETGDYYIAGRVHHVAPEDLDKMFP